MVIAVILIYIKLTLSNS